MKSIFEIICFPITFIMWFLSFLFMLLFCFDMLRNIQNGTKTLVDVIYDINILIHRSYLYDFYIQIPPYARTIISLILYYNIYYK